MTRIDVSWPAPARARSDAAEDAHADAHSEARTSFTQVMQRTAHDRRGFDDEADTSSSSEDAGALLGLLATVPTRPPVEQAPERDESGRGGQATGADPSGLPSSPPAGVTTSDARTSWTFVVADASSPLTLRVSGDAGGGWSLRLTPAAGLSRRDLASQAGRLQRRLAQRGQRVVDLDVVDDDDTGGENA
jgi:hypothetical protein